VTRSSSLPPIFLHIGAMKTGTSYLQRLMAANRRAMADAGFRFPGRSWADHGLATRDVLAPTPGGGSPHPLQGSAWQRLAEEMLAHQGAGSVLSHEFLSFATAVQARRIVDSFPGRELRVILTVRDAAAVIPAQWQTNCRNGGRLPLGTFVRGIQRALDGEPDAGRAARIFQRTQGLPRMLDVWVPEVGADHVHLVTVPPRGSPPDLLWHRFASVLGLDPAVGASGFDHVDTYINTSLGFASTELLRRVNRQLGRVDKPGYNLVVKSWLARRVLGARTQLERPIQLHRSGLLTAAQWNRWVRSAIEDAGVQVVGNLEDLPTGDPGLAAPEQLPRPKRRELLDAAGTAREGLVALRASFDGGGRLPVECPVPSGSAAVRGTGSGTSSAPGAAAVREAVLEVTSLVLDCFARAATDPAVAAHPAADAGDGRPQATRSM
jgi:hypothetical protein